MESLADVLKNRVSAGEALPVESQCPTCGSFDTGHPDVQRILTARDPTGALLQKARCKCRAREEQEKVAREWRWLQSNLPIGPKGPRLFDNFLEKDHTAAMKAAAERFAAGQGPRLLMIQGTKGIGKSHLLEAIVRAVLERGQAARYENTTSFLNRLRHTYSDDNTEDLEDLLAWYRRAPVLVLDEVGLQGGSAWVKEQLTEVIDERLRSGRWLAVASMKGKAEIAHSLGDALASRLFETNRDLGEVECVVVAGKDYRE